MDPQLAVELKRQCACIDIKLSLAHATIARMKELGRRRDEVGWESRMHVLATQTVDLLDEALNESLPDEISQDPGIQEGLERLREIHRLVVRVQQETYRV